MRLVAALSQYRRQAFDLVAVVDLRAGLSDRLIMPV